MVKIESVPALILLIGEWKPMLLPKLTNFTYLAFPTPELWQSEYHLFRLQLLNIRKIVVVGPLVSHVDGGFNLLSFCKHCGTNIIGLKDKHPPIFVPTPIT